MLHTPRRLSAVCLAIALALPAYRLQAAPTQAPAEGPAAAPALEIEADLAEQAALMLERTNAARSAEGLPPYRVNAQLQAAAQAHAEEIAANEHYSHTGLDGRSAKQRMMDIGYGAGREGLRVGENFVARSEVGPAFDWLMSDPPHRANILHPVYREIGIGVGRMRFGYVWVTDLGYYDGLEGELALAPEPAPESESAEEPEAPSAGEAGAAEAETASEAPDVEASAAEPAEAEGLDSAQAEPEDEDLELASLSMVAADPANSEDAVVDEDAERRIARSLAYRALGGDAPRPLRLPPATLSAPRPGTELAVAGSSSPPLVITAESPLDLLLQASMLTALAGFEDWWQLGPHARGFTLR